MRVEGDITTIHHYSRIDAGMNVIGTGMKRIEVGMKLACAIRHTGICEGGSCEALRYNRV